jgi:aminoglycoside/choline kinase family phosphotransferase/dTDP-glucose pyrophosphorylase
MKALILAAGYGTRLLPYTKRTPKALFSYAGRPLIDIIICSLQDAGCRSIIINTHHLHHALDSFLSRQSYAIPVVTRYEPLILGTAGAIQNVADFWDNAPFMVINCDIVTDIDLRKVYDAHLKHGHPVTLVLYDDETFNTVWLNEAGFVAGFRDQPGGTKTQHSRPADEKRPPLAKSRTMTYTGIQVLDPAVLDFIPKNVFSSCIDLYKNLLAKNKKIYAFIPESASWKDLGTPERYTASVIDKMAPEAFKMAFPGLENEHIERKMLAGDGSDRRWYRLTAGNRSLIMVDHGIRRENDTSEVDAFIAIGNHLHERGIPTPKIYLSDAFAGVVFLQDLGDVNLQWVVKNTKSNDIILNYYQSVINILIKLSIKGIKGFDPAWTHQTPVYDRGVILEQECAYFVDAFLNTYLGMNRTFADYENEFIAIAERTIEFSVYGFMHRDLQSRNIMVKNNQPYFIDFQGARTGPIQYDLASLLIDPYVALTRVVQERLFAYYVNRISTVVPVDPQHFLLGYRYCALSRNLQMLGAFGYLSRIKGKKHFENYIPGAVASLQRILESFAGDEFPKLTSTARKIGKNNMLLMGSKATRH